MPAARQAAATDREVGKARTGTSEARRPPSDPRTSIALAPVAQAAPTQVNVRIEGRSETLFEGPILTEGHNVRASSDSSAPPGGRRCNGLNNGQNPSPGPTPTAAG